MGNSSAQNTRSTWIAQATELPDSIYPEVGRFVVPESRCATLNSAYHPALPARIDDAAREAPTSLSLPGERGGCPTPKRCIPLSANVINCSRHKT
jgi:hypothetical protein